jgi:hypothetical protein
MRRSLRSWLWRVPIAQEIDEELALHVELRARELVEQGIDPVTARQLAIRRLRPLPFFAPDRRVTIWETSATSAHGYASPPNMIDWAARSRTFERIAGFAPNVGGMVMAGADGSTETVAREWVSAGIFDVLGVNPQPFSCCAELDRSRLCRL